MDVSGGELNHFGVKGMRWGVRKNRDGGIRISRKPQTPPTKEAAQARKLQDRARKNGVHTLSNRELDALNRRMNLEQQYSRLANDAGASGADKTTKKALVSGGKFVTQILLGVGQQQAKDVLNQKASSYLISQGIKAAKGSG